MVYDVKPLPSKTYKLQQSKYDDVPELPTRMMVVAPSGLTVPLTPTITTTSPENHHDHDTHGGSASSRGARMELT